MRLLIELGVEEIPARFIYKKEEQFNSSFENVLKESNIVFKETKFYATPRRLVFIAEGVNEKIEKRVKKVMGPPKKIAFNNDGTPTKAYESFVNRNNIEDVSLIKIDENSKTQNIFIEIEEGGELVKDILKAKIKKFLESISFPKQMKWGSYKVKFVRPFRWLVSMLDNEIIDVNYHHIKSSNFSYGARFDGNKKVVIDNAKNYEEILKNSYVIVDQQERFDKIKAGLNEVGKNFNASYNPGDDLIWENVYLGEYCNVGYNDFDDKFLQLPDKVLTTSIAVNQKYFTYYFNDDNNLLSIYAFVYEQKEEFIDNIKLGTLKVLRARLNDAVFFFNEDVKRGLLGLKKELSGLKFQEGLGMMLDKVNRVEKIYNNFIDNIPNENSEHDNIENIINLFKNDLVTNMISEKEFTSLQGYMGKIYAQKEGYNDVVSSAIEEHYFPRFSGDVLPTSLEGSYVALFDKIDTIVGMFSINKAPTGSNDPYSLRRQAIGVVRILVENKIEVSLEKLIRVSMNNFTIDDSEKLFNDMVEFFKARILRMYQDLGYEYDVIDSVLEQFFVDHIKTVKTMDVVREYKEKSEFRNIIFSYKRINNILDKNPIEDSVELGKDIFSQEQELELYESYLILKGEIEHEDDISTVFSKLLQIEKPLTNFFDSIMVVSDNPIDKMNRLSLISKIRDLFINVADFSKIVYEKK